MEDYQLQQKALIAKSVTMLDWGFNYYASHTVHFEHF